MKILITGNLGFVGSETQKQLEAHHHEVIGFDVMGGDDIRNYDALEEIIEEEEPDRILHLAAIARFSEADANPKLAHEINVMGTKNVVKAAEYCNIPLVYASTGSVYMPIKQLPPITEDFPAMGNSVYGVTKYLGECYVREHTPHIILRYAHLYGKEKRNHGLIGGLLGRIERGLAPMLYGGKQSNDFTYIKDVARANVLALTAPWDSWNQTYNIGTGEELTTQEAANLICEAASYTGEMLHKEQRTVDPERFVYDTTKAEMMLGFKAQYHFEEGLHDMFQKENDHEDRE